MRPEKPASGAASRFAPPRPAAAAPPPTGREETAEEEELFGEGLPFAEPVEDAEPEAELPFDDFDMVPGYGDDEELPLYPDQEIETLVRRPSRRGLAIVAAIAAVVLVGGASFIVLRSGDTGGGEPPVIAADSTPTKIVPEAAGAADSDQSKQIYDRVAAAEGEPDTTLVTPPEAPVADIPLADADADNPISRVIMPGGPGFDRPVTDEASSASPAGVGADTGSEMASGTEEAIQPIGPRKVRTVVVKPDGTIVSSEATEPGAAEAPPIDMPAAVAEPPPEPPPPEAPPPNNDTMAVAGAGSGETVGGELMITPLPETASAETDAVTEVVVADEPPSPPTQSQPEAASTPVPTPQALPPPPPTPQPAPVVASGGDGRPIDITPGRPTPRPPASIEPTPVATGSGMLVQVSSQRSDEAARATFRDLQSRYQSILGPYDVNIQRANLGDRGVYYRARVGPFPPADAQRLCDDLKAAGGDCILARN
ncbi:MAG: SPOR domain-containing protein [Bauldia sp.]